MIEIWVIGVTGGLVLCVAAVLFIRLLRSNRYPTEADRAEEPDVPLLYMPHSRNTSPSFVRQPVPAGNADSGNVNTAWSSAAAPKPAPVSAGAPAPAQKYVAPSGADVDGIVQLWPGRLVPMDGSVGQEIRFIRTPGVNRFTFGRSTGPAHSHIQLLAPTASRMHAYMIIEDGRWRIGNMSDTNQVLVNGMPLQSGDAERWLDDGDRIELGEIGFIFRER